MNEKVWTIKEILLWTHNYFSSKKIDSPRLTAELLLSKVLNIDRISLYTNFDKPLSKDELSNFKQLIKRRISGEPTAYILGEKEFWSLKFKVNKHTLIPRPETEILVEKVVEYVNSINTPVSILEIGTGSGNIAVSLAKELQNSTIFSIDISLEALKIAKFNSKKHNVSERVFFINSNITDSLKNIKYFDIIVSNPPYIKSNSIDKLQVEIKDFEPLSALNGGSDGLKFYIEILKKAKSFLKENGKIFFEVGDRPQGKEVVNIAEKLGFFEAVLFNDYSNLTRVFSCKI